MSLPSFVASTVRRRRHSLLLGADFTGSTLTRSTYAPTANGIATTTLSATIYGNGALLAGQGVSFSVSRTFVSAANTTVVASPATIQNDGVATSTVTITVKDANGTAIPGIAASDIVVSVSGTGNTVTQPASATNASGQTTASFVSTVSATKTVSVTVCGLAITQTASVVVQGASGTVATVTDISRDAANTDGGTYVEFAITGAVDLPTVTFGGTSATGIVLVNSTTLGCNVPAKAAGIVDVVVGGVAFVNPRASAVGGDFEYLPKATTTFVSADFEGGTLPASLTTDIGTGGSVTVQSTEKYSGTYAVKCVMDRTGPARFMNNSNIDIASETNGVYARFYYKMSSTTISYLQASTGQMKTYLCRRAGGTGQPGWVMTGIGDDFGDGAGNTTFKSFIDNGILSISGGLSGVSPTSWTELVYWQKWNSGSSNGRAKLWINGKCQFDVTDAALGGTNTDYKVMLGIPYLQDPTGTCETFTDEVNISNGFPAPVVV